MSINKTECMATGALCIPFPVGLACVASVSSRGSSRKLGQEQKKWMTGEGEGNEGTSSPLPLPLQAFFCFRSNFRAITRLVTLATQATVGFDFKVCVAVRIGASRSNDADGNENVKKSTSTKWTCLIPRFMEDVNNQRRNSSSLSVLVYGA